jgi:hypothetical protein
VPNINDLFAILALVIGCIVTIFVAVLEIFVLIFIWEGTWNANSRQKRGINLEKLISESTGEASLSRFQLLIFVFVISMSLVLIITSTSPPAFPASIPDQILGLLGISSTSYVLGKALQGQIKTPPPEPPSTVAPPPPPEPPHYDGYDETPPS